MFSHESHIFGTHRIFGKCHNHQFKQLIRKQFVPSRVECSFSSPHRTFEQDQTKTHRGPQVQKSRKTRKTYPDKTIPVLIFRLKATPEKKEQKKIKENELCTTKCGEIREPFFGPDRYAGRETKEKDELRSRSMSTPNKKLRRRRRKGVLQGKRKESPGDIKNANAAVKNGTAQSNTMQKRTRTSKQKTLLGVQHVKP